MSPLSCSRVLPGCLRVLQATVPSHPQRAGMATLKEIQMRLKSITNISKITKSMKMIASTKVQRAQRTLDSSRVVRSSTKALPDIISASTFAEKPELIVVISSDRGLCGGIHTTLSRTTRRILRGTYKFPKVVSSEGTASEQQPLTANLADGETEGAPRETRIVIMGDKARTQLSRDYRKTIALSFNQAAKNGPSFEEAMLVADKILLDKELAGFRSGVVVYNRFKSAIAYETDVAQLHPATTFTTLGSPSLLVYDTTPAVLNTYFEFQVAATIFCAMAEGYASEITARRAAMDNATKNAGDIINKLTMLYNRQRQAAITNDLCDIITGASAL